jgi:hypothetical protein
MTITRALQIAIRRFVDGFLAGRAAGDCGRGADEGLRGDR